MARKKRAGIGAVGKAKIRFFHPSKDVQAEIDKPRPEGEQRKDYKLDHFDDAIIVGKELHRINKKNQMAYLCRLPYMSDNKIYAISCKHVTVLTEGETPFEDEVAPTAPPALSLQMLTLNYAGCM